MSINIPDIARNVTFISFIFIISHSFSPLFIVYVYSNNFKSSGYLQMASLSSQVSIIKHPVVLLQYIHYLSLYTSHLHIFPPVINLCYTIICSSVCGKWVLYVCIYYNYIYKYKVIGIIMDYHYQNLIILYSYLF